MATDQRSKANSQTEEDRRRYQRVRVNKRIRLEATLRGRFIDIMHIEMTGMTIDVSRGGFLANVDQSVTPGVRCRVDLESDEEGHTTQSLWGRVRRTTPAKGGYVLALEFDEPLRARELLEQYGATVLIDEVDEEEATGKTYSAEKDAAAEPGDKKQQQRAR